MQWYFIVFVSLLKYGFCNLDYPIHHPTGQYAVPDTAKHLAAAYHVTHMPQQGMLS